ncbi:MAG: hypothetical protein AB1898_20580 [Acidobacteriota bacterium]
MRVTPSIQTRNFLENLASVKSRLDKHQEELSSGKRVNRLSDDSFSASQASRISALKTANDQFIQGNAELRSRLELVDTTLQLLNQTLDSAKTVVAQALSGTTTKETRSAFVASLAGIKQQVILDANVQADGIYLFAGTDNRQGPFNSADNLYHGNTESISHRLDSSTIIDTNLTGDQILGSGPGGLLQILDDIQAAINDPNFDDPTVQPGLINAIQNGLNSLESISERVNALNAQVGSKVRLIDQVQARLESQNVGYQANLSRLVHANLVESASSFTLAQQALNVSLQAQAKAQQNTLLDYL